MRHSPLPEKRIQGNPLECQLRTFATFLRESGYRTRTIQDKLYLLAAFGWWLGQSRRTMADIDEQLVQTFSKHKHKTRRFDLATLAQFLDHLRKYDVIPHRKLVAEQSPPADILNAYERYLRSERGVIPATIIEYRSYARKFLVDRFGGERIFLSDLKASDVCSFVLRNGRSLGIKRAQLLATAFRSFLRFLFQKGEIGVDLAAAVPSIPNWPQSSLPKYLNPEEVQRVLKACDLGTPMGRRDYAILLLLARLGLRAGEVVALQFEDINWRTGEILVRGKGMRLDRMPLPDDTGNALASYLRRDRPACPTRRVFVCMKAPHRGLAAHGTVGTIVRCAIERANLHPPRKGAHVLRHSLATSMLRSGATMGEIGEVLRHRSPNTTEIYAKVDFDGLRSLAHPWPIGGER